MSQETLRSTPRPAPLARRLAAQTLYETQNVLRNGEQLLVALILPLLVLIGLNRMQALTDIVPELDVIAPGVLALAIMASAFTGQGIATGFERQYGALAFLSTTPLGPTGLILGKAGAVLCVAAVQMVVLGGTAMALGWTFSPTAILPMLLAALLGCAAFTALGLLLAGTVRAEATLAITNVAWVLMGAAGGSVLPFNLEGAGSALVLLPSAALGEALRAGALGSVAVIPLLILLAWAALALLAARRWFRWR